MTTTDTRAAIHAAIRDLFLGSSTPAVARVTIDAAITAHVEAEVARRLAVAPGVEEAIEASVDGAFEYGQASALKHAHLLTITPNWTVPILRTAIAADRERAVRYATANMRPMVSREQAAQLVARFEESIGHELRRRIDGDRKDLIGALTGGDDAPARPTPDEARRLVDALSDAAYDAGVAVERRAGDGWRESVEKKRDDARTALLRALGVEA